MRLVNILNRLPIQTHNTGRFFHTHKTAESGHVFFIGPGAMTMTADKPDVLLATIPTTAMQLVLLEIQVTLETRKVQMPDKPPVTTFESFHHTATARTLDPVSRPAQHDHHQSNRHSDTAQTNNLKPRKIIYSIEYCRVFASFAHSCFPKPNGQTMTYYLLIDSQESIRKVEKSQKYQILNRLIDGQ